MPVRRKKREPEDAPGFGDPLPPLASHARIRPHTLTEELLDWVIAALEAVLSTPQVQDYAGRRAKQSLRDAMKYADHLYPLTLERADEVQDAAAQELRALHEAHPVDAADAEAGGL